MAVPFAWPLLLAVFRGAGLDVLATGGGMALLFLASRLVGDGLAAGGPRTLAPALPPRFAAAAMVGLAAFLFSVFPSHDSVLMGLVFAALAASGCVLTYGVEPGMDRAGLLAAARRLRTRPGRVEAALQEARRRIASIERAASNLHSRELKTRIAAIVAQARLVLAQVERRPGDLERARRFFVTYLDGVGDVVAKYAAQQQDVADKPLAENFRRVLAATEEVFREQEALLKRNEELDLEVGLEVLETQLRREGVH